MQVISRTPHHSWSDAGKQAADMRAKQLTQETGHKVTAEWVDDYNDYSVQGYYAFTQWS